MTPGDGAHRDAPGTLAGDGPPLVDVDSAIRHIHEGGLACFPTETLWSLSCRADHPDAVQAVFRAKGRPEGVPLAVGFHSWYEATKHVRSTPLAYRLAKRFLPGPLSIVLHRTDADMAHVAPGLDTLSVRIPDHPAALRILEACGPLVMTSANRHGGPDPVTAAAVAEALAGVPGLVVVDAPPVPGTASTVVDGHDGRVLREGVITQRELA